MRTLVIIPAYNEEKNIQNVMEELTSKLPQCDYVIINDGSTDNTSQICHQHNYSVIDLPVNLGLTAAVQTAMMYAKQYDYDYAIQIDGDGQHDPAYIEEFEKNMKSGADFVIGSRFITQQRDKNMRMLGNSLIRLALRITTGKNFSDPTSGMRMYNKKIISAMAMSYDLGPEPDALAQLVRSGAKFVEIPVDIRKRTSGESYLGFENSIKYMAYMLASILIFQWFRKKQLPHGEQI